MARSARVRGDFTGGPARRCLEFMKFGRKGLMGKIHVSLQCYFLGVSINGGVPPNLWLVFVMENPIRMDD